MDVFICYCTRKEKCTYSHDPSVIAATHAHHEKLLYSSKFKPRGQDAQKGAYGSVRVLQHANLGAVMDPAMDRLLYYDTFLATFPGGSLVKHVLKKGVIDTLVEAITVPKVLFDTGALHVSYIDKAFVDMHRDKLQKTVAQWPAWQMVLQPFQWMRSVGLRSQLLIQKVRSIRLPPYLYWSCRHQLLTLSWAYRIS